MQTDSIGNGGNVDALWRTYLDAGCPHSSPVEDSLARIYLPYARQIAERLCSQLPTTIDREDVIQSGYHGLLDAIRTYDPAQSSFKTWANRQIVFAIKDSLRAADWLPKQRRRDIRLVQEAIARHHTEHGTQPSDSDIATATGLPVAQVKDAYTNYLASRVHSLDDLLDPETGGDRSTHDRLNERTQPTPEEHALAHHDRDLLREALSQIKPRDRQIIALYYYGRHTYEEIAAIYGITISRVSQIHSRTVTHLRAHLSTL